jgi:hypothetical protein
MARAQSFADKAAKSAQVKGKKCPVCDTVFQPVLLVSSDRSKVTTGWKFSERRIQICKCNEKQFYS